MLDLESPRIAFPIEEACKALCTSRQRLYDLINDGRLRSFKEGKRRYVSRQAILDYIESQERTAFPPSECPGVPNKERASAA